MTPHTLVICNAASHCPHADKCIAHGRPHHWIALFCKSALCNRYKVNGRRVRVECVPIPQEKK